MQASVYALDVPIWMLMNILKGYVGNWNCPEGCIVKSYVAKEAVEFCSEYIGGAETIGVPKNLNTSNKDIRVGNPKFMARDDWKLVHRIVLENTSSVQPYIQWVFDYVIFLRRYD